MSMFGLFIGINDYPGKGSDLQGCLNDARDWMQVFGKLCAEPPITLLDGEATLYNTRLRLREVLASCAAGDTAIVTWSSHGSWVPDKTKDEVDRRDEIFCPHDIGDGQYLLDDELRAILLERPQGSKVFLVTDSCHSGTVFQWAGASAEDNPIRPRFLPPGSFLKSSEATTQRYSALAAMPPKKPSAPLPGVVHLSGCRDTEYSYDASFGKRANGAMSYFALKTYAELPAGATYEQWYARIRTQLPSRDYPQTPQLNASLLDRGMVVPGK